MTDQEKLWSGKFGEDYTKRQKIKGVDTYAFFARALASVPPWKITCAIEFGANVGHNLEALRALLTVGKRSCDVQPYFDGVEINASACKKLCVIADRGWNASVLDFDSRELWDLTVSKGLLIHIAPDDLPKAYDTLYNRSARFILIAEYFNPLPVEVPYRGESEALWKRDFGGDMLDRFSGLKCLDYGFTWARDENPQDNLTWWLFEKEEG